MKIKCHVRDCQESGHDHKVSKAMRFVGHGCFGHETSMDGTMIALWRKDNRGRKNFSARANSLDCQMGTLYFLPDTIRAARKGKGRTWEGK